MFKRDSSSGSSLRGAPDSDRGRPADLSALGSAPSAPPSYVRFIRGWFPRSAAVLATVAIAYFARQLIARHHPGFAPFITFYPAVLLVSLLDGAVAGIAATTLACTLAAVWIFPPFGRLFIEDPYDILSVAIFFTFGVSLSLVIELYHRNRERLARILVDEAVSQERQHQEDERKVAEWVRAERQRLLNVMEALPAMVSVRRPDHMIAFANRSFREKFGDPAGRPCYETRFGRSEPCDNCDTFRSLETGEPSYREVRFPDSSLIEAYGFPFTDLDGSSAVLEMGLDITERRRAEAELQRYRENLEHVIAERTRQVEAANAQLASEVHALEIAQLALTENRAKLQAALSSMTDSVIIADTQGRFVEFNDAFATFYRFKTKEECARNFSEFSDLVEVRTANGALLAPELFPIWRALRGETGSGVEFYYRRKDTGERWIGSLSFSPVRAADGAITGAVITARDVTERKREEETLRQSEKIALQREQFQALAERLRVAREEERTRVSRDLHDQIGQILTAIKLDLTWMNRHLGEGGDDVRNRLQATIALINEGVRSVRKICAGLRPGVLDDLGLAAAIEWQANEFASRTGIECFVSVPATELSLEEQQSTEFFRIFQECLTNVMRHAEAKMVHVSLTQEGDDLVLAVADDGKGFRESDIAGSLGFLGMKERAQVCGASLEIASAPGQGTTVTLRVPSHAPTPIDPDYAHSHHR